MSDEAWMPVLGYEGLYEVSSMGGVRSLDRTIIIAANKGPTSRTFMGRTLRQSVKKGYAKVTLCRCGACVEFSVHSLMLEAFIGSRPQGMLGRHLNDVSTDNRIENLAWGTRLDNAADARRNGRIAWGKRRECSLGHPLGGKNLHVDGYKKCKACVWARASVRSGKDSGGLPLKEIADSYYVRILASPDGRLKTDPGRVAREIEARRLRAEGVTYGEIAKILGVSRITADRYVNGRRVA